MDRIQHDLCAKAENFWGVTTFDSKNISVDFLVIKLRATIYNIHCRNDE